MNRSIIYSSLILFTLSNPCNQPKKIGDKPYDLQRFNFDINAKTFYLANPRDSTKVPYTTDNYDLRLTTLKQDSLICREYDSRGFGDEKYKTNQLAKWGNISFTSLDLFENEKDSVLAIRCTVDQINPIETDNLIKNISKDFEHYKSNDFSNLAYKYFWEKPGKRIKLIVVQSGAYAPIDKLGENPAIRIFQENIVLYIYKLKFVPLSERIVINGGALRDFRAFEIPDEKKYLSQLQFRF
jgi:hypothetical protein